MEFLRMFYKSEFLKVLVFFADFCLFDASFVVKNDSKIDMTNSYT